VARLIGALLVVLALAACGKSAEDKYRSDFPPINRDLAALGEDVAAGLRNASQSDDAAIARQFGAYARRLGELRDKLDELEPPRPVKQDHARLVAAAADTDRALGDVAAAARAGDTVAAGAAATRVVRSGQDLDSARSKVANSGFLH
jgi:hypothetical protein